MKVSAEYLETLQCRIEIIGNNIANVNTPGFKESLLFIEETYDTRERSNTIAQYGGVMTGVDDAPIISRNMYIGRRLDFSQGPLVETGNPLDMAINGDGFFQIKTSDGKIGYTRAGIFSTDSVGNLVNNEGMLLEPSIKIPINASEISVRYDGVIKGVLPDNTEEAQGKLKEPIELGRIPLFKFNNPEGLEQMGHNTFLPTQASGVAVQGTAGEAGYGEIKSGMIERSNTDIVNAMTKLIEAQRAYQFDLRISKNQDEMMQQAITMRV